MGQTGRRSIATHILAVKIALAAADFHSFGVARQGPWITSVNKGEKMKGRSLTLRAFGDYSRITLGPGNLVVKLATAKLIQ
jgi:hypothetical protein